MTQLFVQLTASVTGNVITIVALEIVAAAIGYFIAGPLGGYLLHEFGDVLHRPRQMWWVVTAIGLTGAVLMVIYDKVFKPAEASGARAV